MKEDNSNEEQRKGVAPGKSKPFWGSEKLAAFNFTYPMGKYSCDFNETQARARQVHETKRQTGNSDRKEQSKEAETKVRGGREEERPESPSVRRPNTGEEEEDMEDSC